MGGTMNYQKTFGSNYPSECIAAGTRKDVDDTVINLVNQYNSYMEQGDIKAVGVLFNANRTTLEPYLINARYLNYLEEEVYNTGIAALSAITAMISDTEPLSQDEGSCWYQEY